MSEGHFIIDNRGNPAILDDRQFAEMRQRHKRGTVRLADPAQAPAPATRLVPALDQREVLTLRQAAQLLSVDLDGAAAILSRASTARIVGWDRQAVEWLADELHADPELRRELSVNRTVDGST